MFSGIIDHLGTIRGVEALPEARRLTLATGYADLALGESVAVNGVCLTVVERDASGEASFFVSAETLSRSNLGSLETGHDVNLERAVTLSTRLSGHMVQGHVDGLARVNSVRKEGESYLIELSLPRALYPFCVEKGSIALNGVSLTLNRVEKPQAEEFQIGLTLIPHTWDHTNFKSCSPGAVLNVEVDVIAKYVAKQMETLCHV
jgi:riboflavin synthase